MKIVLVNPISINYYFSICNGTLILATILKQNGYDVEIIDTNFLFNHKNVTSEDIYKDDFKFLVDLIISKSPDYIGFSTMCDTYLESILVSKQLKQYNPNLKIFFGGAQATLVARETMEKFEWIDAICIGESEYSIVPLMKAFNNEVDFSEIDGIMFRANNNVVKTKETRLVENLDTIPFVDFSIVKEWLPYAEQINIDAGRGCPFGCYFCSTKTFFKRKFRIKSAEKLVEEIKYTRKAFQNEDLKFTFNHDLFTANKEKVINICKKFIEENLNIKFTVSARLDTLDEEVINYLAKAGCIGIFMGIEVGSQKMQKIINKHLKLDKYEETLDLLNKYNLGCKISFIYGFPEETEQDLRETLNLYLTAIKKDTEESIIEVNFNRLVFLPGTELFYKYKDDLFLDKEFYGVFCESFATKTNSYEYIVDNKDIFPHFYSYNDSMDIKNLSLFIYYINKTLQKKTPVTYKFLLDYYKDDLLNFYKDFKAISSNWLKILRENDLRILDLDNKNPEFLLKILTLIKEFLNSKHFGKYDTLIKNIYKFESQVYIISYINGQSINLNFDIDVISIIENNMDLDYNLKVDYEYETPMKLLFKVENDELEVFHCNEQ